MKTDQSTRDKTGALTGSGRSSERMRNAEPKPNADRDKVDRGSDSSYGRSGQDDLILHDDDEAELDLPR